MHKEQLSREHRFLKRRLELLTTQTGLHHGLQAGLHGLSSSAPTASSCGTAAAAAAAAAALLSKRRSVSECSVATASSTSSTASSRNSRNSNRSAGSPSVSESGKHIYHISFSYFSSLLIVLYRHGDKITYRPRYSTRYRVAVALIDSKYHRASAYTSGILESYSFIYYTVYSAGKVYKCEEKTKRSAHSRIEAQSYIL